MLPQDIMFFLVGKASGGERGMDSMFPPGEEGLTCFGRQSDEVCAPLESRTHQEKGLHG